MKKILLLIGYSSFVFLTPSSLPALVIITHGGFGQQSTWYQPGGDFFEKVKERAETVGHQTMSFEWQQGKSLNDLWSHGTFCGTTRKEQVQAGLRLALVMWKHYHTEQDPINRQIIILAHSYGGIVSYHASNFFAFLLTNQAAEIAHQPHHCWVTSTMWHAMLVKLISEAEDIKLAAYHEKQEQLKNAQKSRWPWSPFTSACKTLSKKIGTFLSDTTSQNAIIEKQNYPIKALITLATPHRQLDPTPSMSVIGKLYNLHSPADSITHAYGVGLPELPSSLIDHERTIDLVVGVHEQQTHMINHPSHSGIHDVCIGPWLLDLPFPDDTQKRLIIFFEQPDREPLYL